MCPFKAYLQCDFYEIKNITSCQCELEHQNKKKYRLAYNFMFITGSKTIKNQHLLQGWNSLTSKQPNGNWNKKYTLSFNLYMFCNCQSRYNSLNRLFNHGP